MKGNAIRIWGAWLCGFALIATVGVGGRRDKGGDEFFPQDIRLDTDAAGAADSATVRVCKDGNNLFAVWCDSRNGAGDIYFNRSADGGKTWLSKDIRIDTDTAGAARSADPAICCFGGRLHVVWEDERNGEADIYFNHSADGGRTWMTSDMRLDSDRAGAGASGDPQIGCAGKYVFVTWEDDRDGDRDVYFRRSTDHGATWQNEVVLNTNGGGASFSDRPRLAHSGKHVYVVWHDNRNRKFDIYLNASSDHGATWLQADRRLDTDRPGAGLSYDPALAAHGRKVYVAWADIRHERADIHANVSTDGGRTWMKADVRLDTDEAGAAASFRPQIACEDGHVYVAWVDCRDGLADIRFNRSVDRGRTWLEDDVRLDTDTAGAAVSEHVKLRIHGNRVVVAWHDDRDGAYDIRCTLSKDHGKTFLEKDMRLNTNAAGAAVSRYPWLLCGERSMHVFWVDHRDGQGDVYTNSMLPEDDRGKK